MSASRLSSDNFTASVRHVLQAVVVLLCLLGLGGQARAEGTVSLVLSGRGAAYAEVEAAFQEGFGARRPVRVVHADTLGGEELGALIRSSSLVVPVGLGAARQVAAHHGGGAAVLALLVPRNGYEDVAWPASVPRRRLSAVYIDQPAARSFALIDAVLPQAKRVGVMLSEGAQAQLAALQQDAAAYGLKVSGRLAGAPADIAPALRGLLPESDVLLLQPDALVINANNVQNVLLTTYRFRVPVIGFSEGLVKAGAVAAVYSTPAQIGRQGGALAAQWLKSGELPPPMYCKAFSISFNPHVARSLGLVLPAEAEVGARLESAQ